MFTHELGGGSFLERVETRHADAFFAVISNHREKLGRWEAWPWKVDSLGRCREWIARHRDDDARDEGVVFGIWQHRELIGVAALADIHPKHLAATYWGFVVPKVEGCGVADRATRATLDYAFHEIGLERVNWYCAERNHASRGLAARLGFRYNGLLPSYQVIRDQFVDFVLYSMLAREWAQVAAWSTEMPVRRAVPADQAWLVVLAGRPVVLPAWVIAGKGVLQVRWTGGGVVEIQTFACAGAAGGNEVAGWLLRVVGNRLRQQGACLLTFRGDEDHGCEALGPEGLRDHGFRQLRPDLWAKGL